MPRLFALALVFALILANLPPSLLSTAAQEQEFPDAYVGTWEGTGIQTDADGNPDGEWTITITITGGAYGEVVGTVDYPTLGCGGELILNRVDFDDFFLDITEDITYGEDNCLDGLFTIEAPSSDADDTMEFQWGTPDRSSRADGSVTRVSGQGPTTDWQQTTWEGLTISYPSGNTFSEEDASIGPPVRAFASIQPDDCVPGADCPILGFHLIPNEDGLSASDWVNQNGLIVRNFRDVTIADQPGVAFERGDPNEYPGESSTFIGVIGAEILEINGIGYEQEVIEQIVASIKPGNSDQQPVVVYLGGVASWLFSSETDSKRMHDELKHRGLDYPYLTYSYSGGTMDDRDIPQEWMPASYSCDDTSQWLYDSVDKLQEMLGAYSRFYPGTDFILVGHSLGGVIAWTAATEGVPKLDEYDSRIAAVITLGSPLDKPYTATGVQVALAMNNLDCIGLLGRLDTSQLAVSLDTLPEPDENNDAAFELRNEGLLIVTYSSTGDPIYREDPGIQRLEADSGGAICDFGDHGNYIYNDFLLDHLAVHLTVAFESGNEALPTC